jgi:hypothetical protein
MGSTLVGFRLETERRKKLDQLAAARHMTRAEALRDAVKEYLALWIVGSEPTVGRLQHRVEDIEKRLTHLEDLLMKRGAQTP